MKNKTKIISLIITASILFCNTNFLYSENISQEKTSKQESTLVLIKDIKHNYYKQYPQEFLKQKLIEEPNSKISIGFFQLLVILFSDISVFLITAKFTNDALYDLNLLRGHVPKITSVTIPLTCAIIATIWFDKSLTKFFSKECVDSQFKYYSFEALTYILDDYNPTLEEGDIFNTKNYIPQKLHAIFDKLYDIYKNYNKETLKRAWNKIRKPLISMLKK